MARKIGRRIQFLPAKATKAALRQLTAGRNFLRRHSGA
jgi:hypothetical protein